jgi:hypothetical protein
LISITTTSGGKIRHTVLPLVHRMLLQ